MTYLRPMLAPIIKIILRPAWLYSGWGGQRRRSYVSTPHTEGQLNNCTMEDSEWLHPIFASDRIKDRKSIFLAHASALPTSSAFPVFLNHLTSLPALKKATHCMYAYRTTDSCSEPPRIMVGQHDGGENGSGDRLSRLLGLSGYENVVVVVSRWYGGVQLGSDRWKRISDVAKDALQKGGFVRSAATGEPVSKGKQKRGGKRKR
ncbi:ribosomal protein S5 domain 2-type protein [Crucibulum laeve]|uniref:Ribosomal protein S5 domain 2-type protein n=1 Tax=Crucibulum laeve TaxID=68775 RepID=A0A5C3MGC6_9AGAR|nr:ribosomal protein S5 domain 2-type protein [Crucibulum laeve]